MFAGCHRWNATHTPSKTSRSSPFRSHRIDSNSVSPSSKILYPVDIILLICKEYWKIDPSMVKLQNVEGVGGVCADNTIRHHLPLDDRQKNFHFCIGEDSRAVHRSNGIWRRDIGFDFTVFGFLIWFSHGCSFEEGIYMAFDGFPIVAIITLWESRYLIP